MMPAELQRSKCESNELLPSSVAPKVTSLGVLFGYTESCRGFLKSSRHPLDSTVDEFKGRLSVSGKQTVASYTACLIMNQTPRKMFSSTHYF